MATGSNQEQEGPTPQKRTPVKKRTRTEFETPCVVDKEDASSPEKRLRGQVIDTAAAAEAVLIQKAKCTDYLFRLDDHLDSHLDDLGRFELDMEMCKDCVEQLSAVMVKAKRALRDARAGKSSSASPERTESTSAESPSDTSSCSSWTESQRATTDEQKSRLKAAIQQVYACDAPLSSQFNCRFIGWRKLKTDKVSHIRPGGFLQTDDAQESDLAIWRVKQSRTDCLDAIRPESAASESSSESASVDEYKSNNEKIFDCISEPFERLLEQEAAARTDSRVWKRQFSNVRELCDVCNTTIFNGHFGCTHCGFVACLECMRSRAAREAKAASQETSKPKGRGGYVKKSQLLLQKDALGWPLCFRLNLSSLLFIIKDKYISSERSRSKERSSFNIRFLYDETSHRTSDLVYIQLVPPSIFDSTRDDFRRVKEKLASRAQEKEPKPDEEAGKFLVIDASTSDGKDRAAFDDYWRLRKPLVVRNLHRQMNESLWRPDSFMREFGHLVVNLVNCKNHYTVPDVTMQTFWQGFEDTNERLRDLKGEPMILKLKDWPNSDDFKEVLPSRFDDLMTHLPVREYTGREGFFNMASSLSESFLKPDLGPKLYIAYSSARIPREGTTNLHVDISDALNVMMYVGKETGAREDPSTPSKDPASTFMYKVLKESGCDEAQLGRFLNGERPGAIWHLFHPKDADTIRTFLVMSKLDKHKGTVSQNCDPIHDQVNYISAGMLDKLKSTYNVHPYTIIQFLGDAIFIPAGAPHQVRNLNSCIKVAEDFVSPQGIEQCLLITDQLRHLSSKHANHEDKLQIKNILYHKMKDCLSFLLSFDEDE